MPALPFVAPYYDHAGYITALKRHLQSETASLLVQPDFYVITFHGIPDRYIRSSDPYREQCERTAALLAAAMAWSDVQWALSFQSRFGPDAWLELYTEDVLEVLPDRGVQRPLVFAPGFVTDCLETPDERESRLYGWCDGDRSKQRNGPVRRQQPIAYVMKVQHLVDNIDVNQLKYRRLRAASCNWPEVRRGGPAPAAGLPR